MLALSPVRRRRTGDARDGDRESRTVLLALDHDHMFMEDHRGTKIIAGAGEAYPGGISRVDYCVGGNAVLVETRDRSGAFRRATRDVIGLLEGRTPRFTTDDMVEASRLIELVKE